MTDYPKRTIDRTEGNAMFPEGRPTKEEHERMVDHARANRVNKARENGHEADYSSLREQDQYVTSSSVKGMMWEAAEGEDHLHYEMGTIWIYDDQDRVVGRVQIEERSPFPFDKPAKQSATMCLALTRPEEPLGSRHDITPTGYWSREARLVETEEVSVHQGPHGIQWARVWDQREVAQALSEHLGTDPPSLR
jgi:hypothetical protein